MSVTEVNRQLLQHVGSMCLHQLNSCLHAAGPLQMQAVNGDHIMNEAMCNMLYVCDIMERAVSEKDQLILVCCLTLIQVSIKPYYTP